MATSAGGSQEQADYSSSDEESNTAVNPLLRGREELPTTYICRHYYAPAIARSPKTLQRLESTLLRLYSIDKVAAHATLNGVLIVEGYAPEFDPDKVLGTIQKLDPQARFA